MQRRIAVLAAIGLTLSTVGTFGAGQASATGSELSIEVVSTRADLVSGGDALVKVNLPRHTDPRDVRIDVSGRDVTGAFHGQPDGSLLGLVDGMSNGRNVISAHQRHGSDSRLVVTNHPIGGPLFAGPQVQPWVCGTVAAG